MQYNYIIFNKFFQEALGKGLINLRKTHVFLEKVLLTKSMP